MIPYKSIPIFKISSFEISSYAVMLLIAGAVGIILTIKESKRKKIDNKKFLYSIPLLILGAYIGSRLFYYFSGFHYRGSVLRIIDITSGGAVFYGGFLGAVLAVFIYTKIRKENFWIYCDTYIPSVALGLFLVRIGCFLRGCCHGIITKFPLAVYYIEQGILRHPTQLYSSFFGLCLFLFLSFLKTKKRFNGFLFLNFILFYSVFRFFIEFIRATPKIFLSLSLSQWISIVLCIFAVLFLWKKKIKFK